MDYGYAGKILEINLDNQTITEYPPETGIKYHYLSGVGFNARILYDRISPEIDALSPENVLIFSTGVFCGTNIPTACRTEASALSPATGLFGTANSGSYWGGELKFAGFDSIIITGRATGPVYIFIHNNSVQILPARHLWGRDAWATIDAIRDIHGDREIQVACIGPAGEKLVRFASIENGPYDAWGRTGLGAVMGAKNLKAIAVRGTGTVKVARKKEFISAVNKARQKISGSPFFTPFKKFGTMLATIPYQNFGILPGRNFQTGTIENWETTRTRKQLPRYTRRGIACMSCPIACAHWVEIDEGPYAGLKLKDLEVTPVIGFGAGCDINNLPAIAHITAACQRWGMDMVSTAASVALTMELYQRKIISKKDLGFDITWGDEEGTMKLIACIARREGFGDILAEGTRRAAAQIRGSRDYTTHIKGLECFLFDPRARWSTWTLGFITNIRGGDSLRTRSPVENLRYNENPRPYLTEKFGFPEEMLENLDMPDPIKKEVFDPVTGDVHIARMSKWAEDLISVYNAVGLCIRPPVLHTIGPTLIAELYSSLTGMAVTPGEITRAGERIWNVQKMFNIRHGEKPEDSRFPPRFYKQSASGRALDPKMVDVTLREYYKARKWDPETGRPLEQKLKDLNITGARI